MVKRADGRWQETVHLPGMDKPKYFYGKTKAEIKKKIIEWELQQELKTGFASVAEEWWDVHSPKLSFNSRKPYEPALKRAQEYFGDVPINTLKPVDIARMLKQFAHKGYAQKTVNTQRLVINQICSFAVERGYCDANAARDIKAPEGVAKKKVSASSSDDIARVKASVDCTFGLFAFMALYTGMRCGELLALTWEDVDLNKRLIYVTKSIYHDNNKPVVKKPKTETSLGAVPILDALLPVLVAAKKKGVIFADSDGGYLTQGHYKRKWKAYTEESGVTATPHRFRHAYATMLFEAGVPAEKAQVLLRHAQIGTTMDVYRDIRADRLGEMFKDVYAADIT